MGQLADLYAEGRDRFIDVVSGLDDVVAATLVPTCPAWSVKDAVAHVTGICADILAGRLDGVATDAWTAAQVDARRGIAIAGVIAEWQETGPQVDAIIDGFGPAGEQLLTDLTTHEYDVRYALGRPGRRDLPVFELAVDFTLTHLADRLVADSGSAPIEVRSAGRIWKVGGDGEPGTTLTAEPFDILRMVTGRRSTAQVKAMDWSADPSPWLPAFEAGLFTFCEDDVLE